MKTIITSSGQVGKFNDYQILDDRYLCDGVEYPFAALGETHSIGDYVDPGLTTDELNAIKARVWEEIKAFRDNRILNGGYPVGAHWYYSDLIARSQHQANARKADIIQAASGDMNATMTNVNGNPIYIKSMDNGYMPISATTAHAIVEQAEAHEMATYAAAIAHKTALYASSNPAAYDYSSGWPAIYTGA